MSTDTTPVDRTFSPERIQFFVPGKPAPQGSKRHVGNGIMIESSKSIKGWRTLVGELAYQHFPAGPIPRPHAVAVELRFVMPRPSATPKRRPTPAAIKRPDIDKLTRGCLDALSGVGYQDDSQVTTVFASKRIAEAGETSGVAVTVTIVGAGVAA